MLRKKAAFFLRLVLLTCLLIPVFAQSATADTAISEPVNALVASERLNSEPATSEPVNSVTLPNALERETLRIDGSATMTAINQTLKQRYEKQFPESKVQLNASGAEPALKALLNNEIDLAAVGRSLTPDEKAQGLMEVPLSRDQIAIVIGQANPFAGSLTLEQLSKIFRGEITDWAEVGGTAGPIRVIDRPIGSDTRLALQHYRGFESLVESDATEAPEKPEQFARLKTDDTAALLEQLGDDGIGYAIASQLASQDKAKLVKLTITQTVLPEDALYPYTQLRGYAYRNLSSSAQAFLGFAATRPGQAAVAAAKLEEAKAVANGQPLVQLVQPEPLVPVVQPISQVPELPDSPAVASQRFQWQWLLLLLGLPLFWLLRRGRQSTAVVPSTSPLPAPPAVSPAPPVNPAPTIEVNEPTINAPNEPAIAELAEPATELVASEWLEESVAAPTVVFQAVSPEPIAELVEAELVEAGPEAKLAEPEATTQTRVGAELTAVNPLNVALDAETDFAEATELIAAPAELAEPAGLEASAQSELFSERDLKPIAPIASEVNPAEVSPAVAEPEISSEMSFEQIEADLGLIEAEQLEVAEAIETELETESTAALDEPEEMPEPLLAEPIELVEPVRQTATELASLNQSLEAASLQTAWIAALAQHKTPETASLLEAYSALAKLICHQLLSLKTPEAAPRQQKIVGEIAAEYLPGPHLENSLINLGRLEEAREAAQLLGLNWQSLIDQEEEPGLGKGGLGRLMICYLDSLATLKQPAIGYGLRYEYGIFDQEIRDGWQVERADSWLRYGNPWEVERPDLSVQVGFAGSTAAYLDDQGRYRLRWAAAETVRGIPYDSPIPGYRSETVSLMRLWRAEDSDLCKVLYPVDSELQGRALRLKQQFFLVSCALQDALRLHLSRGGTPETLAHGFALQINDTDPSLAVVELMRLLVDEQALDWQTAWTVTQQSFAYTNHSLMPETLDDLWTIGLFQQLLPRHLEIVYEINYRLLEAVKERYPNDSAKLSRMSLIDERGERYLRLNFLACVGSHAVNGVSNLHTQLLQQTVFRDFYELAPEKFSSQTNGITPRRFLLQTNPELAALISSKLGDGWITDLSQLSGLEAYVADPLFCTEWLRIKQSAKRRLATQILSQTGIAVNPNSLFDLQAMVIHEYKRQHLNLLHILTLYQRLKANPNLDVTPRSFIFAGKAAPDYFTAKLIIRLIHAVADLVNADIQLRGRLKVVFLPDLNIKTAQPLYPAADLSEHLSLAGTEAADTGNLIAALNGALIIGTADGTNLELRQAVGAENCFEFGLSLAEAQRLRAGGYSPMARVEANLELRSTLDLLTSGQLSGGDPELFQPLVNLLLYYDQYLLLADYTDYIAAQEQVSQAYRDTERWTRMSILSTARLGYFSSDRAVQAYCQQIWQIPANRPQPEYAQPKKRLG